MDDFNNEFEDEPATKVETIYYAVGGDADRQRARNAERRAAEVTPPVVAARGTREWVSK